MCIRDSVNAFNEECVVFFIYGNNLALFVFIAGILVDEGFIEKYDICLLYTSRCV